jgi:hypothetical protein
MNPMAPFRASHADKIATALLAEIDAADSRGWTSTERKRATAVFAASVRNGSTEERRSGIAIAQATLRQNRNGRR